MSEKQPDSQSDEAEEQQAHRDSLLETFESLVVAFILAFVFRAYVVEAFIIPTGSMAPHLNGEHYEYVCANCGYEFNVGVERDPRTKRIESTPEGMNTVCTICGSDRVVDQHSPRYFGDRILVLKYMYDFFPPKRWDVIVFKWPLDPSQNYIKRLIGLPGEAVRHVMANWKGERYQRHRRRAREFVEATYGFDASRQRMQEVLSG